MNKYNVSLLGNTDNNVIADTETDDYDNIRYVGASPNNYLTFNDETWRIIGIFNVYNTETSQYEKLIKIIRNESLGIYSWDTSDSTVSYGYGINEWSKADLMTELNTDYLDTSKTSGTTTWYNDSSNTKTAIYDYSKNIKSGFIDKVANVRWNLGGYFKASILSTDMYKYERGTLHLTDPIDGITRTDFWDGKIALMYPSDYGYASIDTTCRNNLNSSNCKNNNWLFNSSTQWTLTSSTNDARNVYNILSVGMVSVYSSSYDTYAKFEPEKTGSTAEPYMPYNIRPTLYLKSDVAIKSGTGTSTNPFVIN